MRCEPIYVPMVQYISQVVGLKEELVYKIGGKTYSHTTSTSSKGCPLCACMYILQLDLHMYIQFQ